MPGQIAAVLLALMVGSQSRAEEPTIELDVVIARLRPDAWAALQGPLSRSMSRVEMKDAPKGALAGVLPPEQGDLFSLLQKLETKGVAKLVAQPRLTTRSGQPASFLDGGEAAIPVPAGLGKVGVQFEEFGTRLNFLPKVASNGVSLDAECEFSTPSRLVEELGSTLTKRDYCRTFSNSVLKPGERLVLAGMPVRETVKEQHGVPGLSAMPLIGGCFRWEKERLIDYRVIVVVRSKVLQAEK